MFSWVLFAISCFLVTAEPQSRIVGGQIAKEGQFPYMALVSGGEVAHCGGSIITERFILTAAHCVEDYFPNMMSVKVGALNRQDEGEVYKVQQYYIHPGYVSAFLRHDIALLRVAEDIKLSDNVQTIPLNTDDVYKYRGGVVSGWGRTEVGEELSDELQYVNATFVSQLVCTLLNNEDASTKVCAGVNPDTGFCMGDSGGPLVADGLQVGVVSGFVGQFCSDNPNIYMRVDKYAEWILAVVLEDMLLHPAL